MTGQVNNRTSVDFKTQVQQFLKYDEEKHRSSKSLHMFDSLTVFTVYFGLWDLLEYSTLESEFAIQAIDNSIAELFHQLDLLAERASVPMKVVIPRMVDTTFLPRFMPTMHGIKKQSAQTQHQRVFLSTYWNDVLLQSAMQWPNGEVFMPDPNAVIIEQVRAKQLYSEGIMDASGAGESMPLFQYVEQPCLIVWSDSNTTDLQAAAIEKCSDPTAHLFWSVSCRTIALSQPNQITGTTYILVPRHIS